MPLDHLHFSEKSSSYFKALSTMIAFMSTLFASPTSQSGRVGLRKILYNSPTVQRIYGLLKNRSVGKSYNFGHLALYEPQKVNGAILKDEALLIYALIKMIRPKVVVEFGFSRGHSSLNFLEALDETAEFHSYDISSSAAEIAKVFQARNNFHFHLKSQLDFDAEDVGHKKVDLVYFDAVYDAELNMATLQKLMPSLSDNALLILHDTDTWKKHQMDDTHVAYAGKRPQNWLNENEFQQQKGQREFSNAIVNTLPEFSVIHLHGIGILRSGFTLVQRKKLLPTE